MDVPKLAGILLIALGLLALIYGGFTYGEAVSEPQQLQVGERDRATVPLWAGIATLAAGTALLLIRKPA